MCITPFGSQTKKNPKFYQPTNPNQFDKHMEYNYMDQKTLIKLTNIRKYNQHFTGYQLRLCSKTTITKDAITLEDIGHQEKDGTWPFHYIVKQRTLDIFDPEKKLYRSSRKES